MQERNAVHAIQKSFLLLRQNLKWQNISICKWDFFFDSCKLWKTLNGIDYFLDLVKVKRKSSEVCATILLMGSV